MYPSEPTASTEPVVNFVLNEVYVFVLFQSVALIMLFTVSSTASMLINPVVPSAVIPDTLYLPVMFFQINFFAHRN